MATFVISLHVRRTIEADNAESACDQFLKDESVFEEINVRQLKTGTHGTKSCYDYHDCRCAACCEANSRYQAKARRTRKRAKK